MSTGSKKSPSKARVLVVDDESSVLFTYKLILEQQGYAVTAAISSEEAKRAIEAQEFDLVLCDYSLEQQHTGFEVIAAARARRPDVPSLLLTGYATIETTEQAKSDGIGVLFKPIDIAEFLSTTSAFLRNEHESQKVNKDE
ncbi:MAG: response regulator receiver protein [Acidobacteriales bacterium]|nr:response regulator receiver protein [Terriglobales bacterium]